MNEWQTGLLLMIVAIVLAAKWDDIFGPLKKLVTWHKLPK